MTWAGRFRIRQRLSGSLWVMPLPAGVLGAGLGAIDVGDCRRDGGTDGVRLAMIGVLLDTL